MSINDIVNVQITRETASVSRQGFGTILILGPNVNSPFRTEEFQELADIADAVVGGINSPEYQAAANILSQSPRVTRLKLGNLTGTRTLTDNAGTYTAGSAKVTVNGDEITQAFDTDKNTTLTALAAQIAAHAAVDTAVYTAGSHTIVITPLTGNLLMISFDLTVITGTMDWELTATATEDYVDALNAIVGYDNDWYGLVIISRTEQDQLDVAAWVETQSKILGLASDDADIVDLTESGDTTTIAYQLKALGYARTFLFYHSDAANSYPEAALLGKVLPYDPGSYTAKFKTLSSIAVDILDAGQRTNALAKNVNIYEEVGGVNIVEDGKVVEGEWLDVIIFVDWLDANMTADVFELLKRLKKVPYTNAGIAAIQSIIIKRLVMGQDVGGISPMEFDADEIQIGGFNTSVPALADVSSSDKAARILNNVKFTAWLAGAIHVVNIQGIITV